VGGLGKGVGPRGGTVDVYKEGIAEMGPFRL